MDHQVKPSSFRRELQTLALHRMNETNRISRFGYDGNVDEIMGNFGEDLDGLLCDDVRNLMRDELMMRYWTNNNMRSTFSLRHMTIHTKKDVIIQYILDNLCDEWTSIIVESIRDINNKSKRLLQLLLNNKSINFKRYDARNDLIKIIHDNSQIISNIEIALLGFIYISDISTNNHLKEYNEIILLIKEGVKSDTEIAAIYNKSVKSIIKLHGKGYVSDIVWREWAEHKAYYVSINGELFSFKSNSILTPSTELEKVFFLTLTYILYK